jgi:hypothetical protein
MIKESKVDGLEYIYNEGELYCIILRDDFFSESISFFTPPTLSQQLGFLPHKKGALIQPHRHIINKREILYTQEVLIIKKGKVKVLFYNHEHINIGTEIIQDGDVIALCAGGHGFEMLEYTIMVEVKQGPYTGINDKERFSDSSI